LRYQALGSHFDLVFVGKHEFQISNTKLNPVKRSVLVIGQTKIYERYRPNTTAHEPKLLKGALVHLHLVNKRRLQTWKLVTWIAVNKTIRCFDIALNVYQANHAIGKRLTLCRNTLLTYITFSCSQGGFQCRFLLQYIVVIALHHYNYGNQLNTLQYCRY